jgi:excisionase family DNA binding protein
MEETIAKILLKVTEVRKSTGFSRSKLYSMIASGELPSIRVGRSVRVPADALREWIERKMAEQTTK